VTYEIDLGPWGIELDDADFGRALAALGVALADPEKRGSVVPALRRAGDAAYLRSAVAALRPTPWRLDPVTTMDPVAWAALATRFPAARQAAAWAEAVGERSPNSVARLAVARFSEQIGQYWWLADQIGQPSVFSSMVVVADELKSEHTWHWPLRIGLFDDPDSASFRARVQRRDWSSPLYRLVEADGGEGIEILLLPAALPQAVSRLTLLKDRLNVGCVAVLGGIGGQPDDPVAGLLASLRLRGHPWGVAVADVPATAWDAWLSELIYTFSHDTTLDVALRQALVGRGRGVLLAEMDGLANAVVSRAASRLVREMAGASRARRSAEGDGAPALTRPDLAIAAEAFSISGEATPEAVDAAVRDPASYTRELDGATATAALAGHVERRRRARPPGAESRWIQVAIRKGPRFAGDEQRAALAPRTLHSLDVWIGPESKAIHADVAFPDEELPRDGSTYRLTVVLSELDAKRRTTTGHILLPPTGAARAHRFYFRTPASGSYRARIVVAYRGRILQTALLNAPVGSAASTAANRRGARENLIRLSIEAAVRPGLAELKGRRQFGAAFIHNHDERGASGGTVIGEHHAVPLNLGNLDPTVKVIGGLLSDAAQDAAAYGPTLEADATVGLLFKLARQGVLLHDDLLGRPGVADLVKAADRIQVVTADPNAILPLEFIYDFPTPARPPKLCPNARQALLDGHCSPEHHKMNEEGNIDVVCPVGFWAMNRVIERHVADPEGLARQQGGIGAALEAEPVRDRDRLPGITGAVFASSARVDQIVNGATKLVETALSEATGGHATRVKTWLNWVEAVRADQPSLLVLLAHSVRDEVSSMTALEIEADERRDASELTSRYLRPDADGKPDETGPAPPIVLLLGCDTAVADLQYQTFVTRFRQLGAALVVGTIATVAGSHAAGVAAALAGVLKRPDDSKWVAFGDLLRDARRRLLSDGEVMALSLTAYGDADWRFPGGRA
jgi:hypothetical protein